MSEPATQPSVPIALASGEGDAFWFFGTLATIKASSETTSGRVAVTAHLAPEGAASPLHVHHNEDEWFYVTEGAATFWLAARPFRRPPVRLYTDHATFPTRSWRRLRKLGFCWLLSVLDLNNSCACWVHARFYND